MGYKAVTAQRLGLLIFSFNKSSLLRIRIQAHYGSENKNTSYFFSPKKTPRKPKKKPKTKQKKERKCECRMKKNESIHSIHSQNLSVEIRSLYKMINKQYDTFF